MYCYPLAFATSLTAFILIVAGYFVRKKFLYLASQFLGIIFLVLSYFFSEQFFAMISLSVGFVRTLVFFIYEKKNIVAPIIWSFIFSIATFIVYIVIELIILKNYKIAGVLNLISLCSFAFIFRMRNLKLVRYLVITPIALSIAYNILINAPIFSVLSYTFELCAAVFSTILYYFIEKRNKVEQIIK